MNDQLETAIHQLHAAIESYVKEEVERQLREQKISNESKNESSLPMTDLTLDTKNSSTQNNDDLSPSPTKNVVVEASVNVTKQVTPWTILERIKKKRVR